ncbi:MAG: ExeA family protein, partial [Candidatus Competibacterales bacterium]
MYARHFALKEPPFAITPDPAYLYLSGQHQEALAHLLYGTSEYGGFVQLTGIVGTGKTTLLRTLLARPLETVDVALCFNPHLEVVEFVAAIAQELGVDPPPKAGLKGWVGGGNAQALGGNTQGDR